MKTRASLLVLSVLCFVGAGLVGGAPARAVDAPGAGFFGYTLTAQANGIQATEDQPSANSHPEGEGELPHTQISLTSGPVGYALGSAAWPGALGGNAGSLILLVAPTAPSQVTLLNDPVRAEARTGTAQDDVTNDDYAGVTMKAVAKPDRVAADAVIDGGDGGATLGFGSSSSASKAVLGAATATVTADSTAKDVTLAGGAVRLGSVVSHAQATTDGITPTASGSTSVTGMSIGGVPVTVDEHGVTVAGTNVPVDPVAAATVNSVLANLNMTIALSTPTVSRNGGTISYDAGSLIVLWQPQGSVNVFTAHLGGARVLAGATPSSAPQAVVAVPVSPVTTSPGTEPPPALILGGQTPQGPGASVSVAPAAPPVANEPAAAGAVPAALLGAESVPPSSTALIVLGGLLLLAALTRLPGFVLFTPQPVRCPLEEPS